MTFQRLDLLPDLNLEKRGRLRSRWQEYDSVRDLVVTKIRAGAGEDFLQWEFENGQLGFMDDFWDLAGIELFNEDIDFPTGDNFENINFSYSEFWHCKFKNATFPQTYFGFSKLYNVEFRNCLFAFAHFYGAKLEKCNFINCDFADENGFFNCEFLDTKFEDCFFNKDKFTDCKFDENVIFELNRYPQVGGLLSETNSGFKEKFESRNASGIYRGIKEGFLAGRIYGQARKYSFRQQQAYTRFNLPKGIAKTQAYAWELLAGYGFRPSRVLITLFVMFTLASSWFAYRLESVQDSLIISAGAFLTFGAKAELLSQLSLIDHIFYITSAFAGVSLVALFITVMANVLLKDR
jgi:hypothetical protein